mmetsp:Transcript_80808/g.145830  ORF Transcript_80808/g.145830 Transcript_80808/m.145830 type:complete len:726 (+) Transcript_80808:104-2281(+)
MAAPHISVANSVSSALAVVASKADAAAEAAAAGSQRPAYNGDLGEFDVIFKDIDPAWLELYAACCHDTGEVPVVERARRFRDTILAQNPIPIPEANASPMPGSPLPLASTLAAALPDAVPPMGRVEAKSLSLKGLRLGAASASCLVIQLKGRGYTRLDLSNNQIGDAAAPAICGIIHNLPKLRCLVLAGNILGPVALKELSIELAIDEQLEALHLGTPLARGAPAVMLRRNQHRQLRPNMIGSEGLQAVLRGFSTNPCRSLTTLVLCRTSLEAEAGIYLASFMEQDTLLRHLDVSGNPLSSEGVCALLPACANLKHLDLGDTGCRGELIHAQLSSMLQRATNLAFLSLAFNTIETRPLRRITRAVAACEPLVSLNLAGTQLDTECVSVLADSFLHAPDHYLRDLDLSDNNFSEVEAATALAYVITNSKLQVLRLNRNALGDAGVSEIADALSPKVCPPDGPTLFHLELGSCRIGLKGAGHLFSCVAQNKSLRVLKLNDNLLDDSLDLRYIDELGHIQELFLKGNRLNRKCLQFAADTCKRNMMKMRDAEPSALRNEVKRLLVQETKLLQARHQTALDEAEIFVRVHERSKVSEELRKCRIATMKQERQASHKMSVLEDALEARRSQLDKTKSAISEAARRNEVDHAKLKSKLAQHEQELTDVQAQQDVVEKQIAEKRKVHPSEVAVIKAKVKAALDAAEQAKSTGADMRQQLKTLQEKSLIDFRP